MMSSDLHLLSLEKSPMSLMGHKLLPGESCYNLLLLRLDFFPGTNKDLHLSPFNRRAWMAAILDTATLHALMSGVHSPTP